MDVRRAHSVHPRGRASAAGSGRACRRRAARLTGPSGRGRCRPRPDGERSCLLPRGRGDPRGAGARGCRLLQRRVRSTAGRTPRPGLRPRAAQRDRRRPPGPAGRPGRHRRPGRDRKGSRAARVHRRGQGKSDADQPLRGARGYGGPGGPARCSRSVLSVHRTAATRARAATRGRRNAATGAPDDRCGGAGRRPARVAGRLPRRPGHGRVATSAFRGPARNAAQSASPQGADPRRRRPHHHRDQRVGGGARQCPTHDPHPTDRSAGRGRRGTLARRRVAARGRHRLRRRLLRAADGARRPAHRCGVQPAHDGGHPARRAGRRPAGAVGRNRQQHGPHPTCASAGRPHRAHCRGEQPLQPAAAGLRPHAPYTHRGHQRHGRFRTGHAPARG